MLELTKDIINKASERGIDLSGYNLLIFKIEKNSSLHPDIAIESCKSLIEGVAKKSLSLVSLQYQEDKQLRKSCNNSMPTLVKNAFQTLFQSQIEVDMKESLYHIIRDKSRLNKIVKNSNDNFLMSIKKIDTVRGNKGDISHGRIYPKDNESSISFSKSIISITDGIVSFMIHELINRYSEIQKEKGDLLKYGDKELAEFNNYLDAEEPDFQIKTKPYSFLLYKYDKNEYFRLYEEEFKEEEEEIEREEFKKATSGYKASDVRSIRFTSEEDKGLIAKFADEHLMFLNAFVRILEQYFITNEMPLKSTIKRAIIQQYEKEHEEMVIKEVFIGLETLIKKLTSN